MVTDDYSWGPSGSVAHYWSHANKINHREEGAEFKVWFWSLKKNTSLKIHLQVHACSHLTNQTLGVVFLNPDETGEVNFSVFINNTLFKVLDIWSRYPGKYRNLSADLWHDSALVVNLLGWDPHVVLISHS